MSLSTDAPPTTRPDTSDPDRDGTTHPVRRMLWHLTPAAPQPAARPLAGRRVAVIGGTAGDAERVRAALRGHGADVEDGTRTPPHPDLVPDTIVDLTLAEPYAPGTPGQWHRALLRTFALLRRCHRRWSEEETAGRLCYLAVTYLGGGMGHHPDDDLAQPLGGLWAGLAKTLHREFPACAARVLDIGLDDTGRLPDLVAAELATSGLIEIGHRDGRRWTLTPYAAEPGPPDVRWSSGDTVLISGGGRGIGMALARRIARESGARVVVTGRAALPPEETWPELTPEALDARRTALWARRGDGTAVAEIRAGIARAEQTWDVVANLGDARAQGLRVEYRRCDFTDPDQVRRLVAGLPGLTGVVHNAGVDRPTRLPGKSDADIAAVVATKVDAFGHLFEAVRDRDLKVFCTVGSLTGRLGGMVGQFDYAAANECLARLGRWAQRQARFPVMTLAWPTWARLGLIANFRASLRYMAAMDVTEGLGHWRAELLAGTSGEVSFVGPVGPSLGLTQAVGHPLTPALPGFTATWPKIFHLGTPERYRPHRRLVSRLEFDPATTCALGDFTVDGDPALPVGLLLESAVRGAEWVAPEQPGPRRLAAIEDVSVPWSLLVRGADGTVRLRRDVRGREHEGRWTVDVTFRAVTAPVDGPMDEAVDGPLDGPVARMRLVYAEGDAAPADPARPAAAPPGREGTLFTSDPVLNWRGLAIPVATWHAREPGRLVADVPGCHPADLWAVPRPPACAVPVAEIENVVRAVSTRLRGLATTPDPLTLTRVVLHGRPPERTRVSADTALGVWRITDARTGAPVAVIHRPAHPTGHSPDRGEPS
ncbi:KR domain-containing protein [Streptomyces sp. NPDC047974]|uniref:KR domain-containing protein n=1 Tax=Streptomyces sp. NPDC047974 TaxID=3154343 RepID=UPI0033EBB4FE